MANYWQKRQELMYQAGEMKMNQYFTRLEKAFNQTRRELQKIIEAFYFRYAEEKRPILCLSPEKAGRGAGGGVERVYQSGNAKYWQVQPDGQ